MKIKWPSGVGAADKGNLTNLLARARSQNGDDIEGFSFVFRKNFPADHGSSIWENPFNAIEAAKILVGMWDDVVVYVCSVDSVNNAASFTLIHKEKRTRHE